VRVIAVEMEFLPRLVAGNRRMMRMIAAWRSEAGYQLPPSDWLRGGSSELGRRGIATRGTAMLQRGRPSVGGSARPREEC